MSSAHHLQMYTFKRRPSFARASPLCPAWFFLVLPLADAAVSSHRVRVQILTSGSTFGRGKMELMRARHPSRRQGWSVCHGHSRCWTKTSTCGFLVRLPLPALRTRASRERQYRFIITCRIHQHLRLERSWESRSLTHSLAHSRTCFFSIARASAHALSRTIKSTNVDIALN